MSREPVIDATATAELVVGPNDLASSIATEGGDQFRAVLATARMVALMETAAARVLQPFLGPGELSVGVTIDIIHSAPTPPGIIVTANARYTGRDGKLFVFEISAHDQGGEAGRGSHKRAVVETERLVRAAAKRNGRTG
jgi:predicted thioesterase